MILTAEDCQKLRKVVKIRTVCRLAGLSNSTIWDRIERKADLTEQQSLKIIKVLDKHGISLKQRTVST